MPFLKSKKGAAGGLTALVLFGMFILMSNFIYFALTEFGIMTTDTWIQSTVASTMFMFTFMILYYVLIRNVHEQGKQAGMMVEK